MKRIYLRILGFMALLLACLPVQGQEKGASGLVEADSAYSRGEYPEAVEIYTRTAASQGVSSSLYYDLGNAYAKGGDYGKAMISYLRALRLDPSNSQAKANIDYIDSKVYDSNRSELKGRKYSVDPESPAFFASVKSFISAEHRSDTWAAWALVSFLLFVGAMALYIFTRNVLARKIGFFGGIVFLGFSVIALVFSFMAASYRSDEGVLTGAKVKLRSDASASAKELAVPLSRGTRMTVLDSLPLDGGKAQWYKVRLNSDFVGWVEASDFETVDM